MSQSLTSGSLRHSGSKSFSILNHIKARIHDFSHIHNKLLELERWFRNHVDFETYLGLDFDEDETDRHRRSTEKKKQDRFKIIEPEYFRALRTAGPSNRPIGPETAREHTLKRKSEHFRHHILSGER